MSTVALEPPYLAIALLMAASSGLASWLAVRNRRRGGPPPDTAVAVLMALMLAVAAGTFGSFGYQRYVVSNTWTYSYQLEVQSNDTTPGAIIVPIPLDESLLRGLRVDRGHANWSLVDSIHGRGLRLEFYDPTLLGAFFSEFSVWGSRRSTGLSLMDDSNQPGALQVWIFFDGQAGTQLRLHAGGMAVIQPLTPGWNSYPLLLTSLS